MDVRALLVDRTRHLMVVASGLIFAVSGLLAISLSGEDFYSTIVGVVFFLVGAGMIVFAERVNGNI